MAGSKTFSSLQADSGWQGYRLKAVCTDSRCGTLEADHAKQSGSDDAERLMHKKGLLGQRKGTTDETSVMGAEEQP